MKYDILTDTAFFRAAQNGDTDRMTASYGNFLDPIPYSRTYTNIKSRSVQNGGRAYFLTEMRQLLNERIDQDARIMRGR